MITVITPTGDRPEVWELSKRWMKDQVVKPDQWIIIDDGQEPYSTDDLPDFAEYVRREPRPNETQHTLITNLFTAFPLIKGDKVLFWEDDEWYAPSYIKVMSRALDMHEVVGIGHARYYHLFSGHYMLCNNEAHASLAQTGIRASFIPEVIKLTGKLGKSQFLDGAIWEYIEGTKDRGFLLYDEKNPLYVAMKGMPGRMGIGNGHRNINEQIPDTDNKDTLR